MVSWTTGTGLIGPIDFEIGGKHYRLELRHSDKLGKIAGQRISDLASRSAFVKAADISVAT
jgi:hypothetical protein